MQKKGFTLIEVLTVIVIISLAVTMSVPAYKRARASSQFEKAKGQLAQIGTAVQAFRRDLSPNYFPAHMAGEMVVVPINLRVLKSWQEGIDPNNDAHQQELSNVCNSILNVDAKNTCLRQVLFERGYLLPSLVFDAEDDTLYDYAFFICDQEEAIEAFPVGGPIWRNRSGCNVRKDAAGEKLGVAQPVATMQLVLDDTHTEAKYRREDRLPFFRAVFLSDGTIERKSYAQSVEEETESGPGPEPFVPGGIEP